MLDSKTIDEMLTRFTKIVNSCLPWVT